MNIENVRLLAEIVSRNGLTSLEISEENIKIKIEKKVAAPEYHVDTSVQTASAETINNGLVDFNHLFEVKSPMVGVFYSASSPDSDPFVSIGDKVKKGDVLCIIEAMKLMNEITAEKDGEIVDICVKNGDVAEFGQTLYKMY